MKKRKTLVFMIFALLANVIPCAYAAQGAIDAVLTFDNSSNAVVVSGTAQAVKKNTSFTLVVTAPDSSIAFTDQVVGTVGSDGKTSFEFKKFPFDMNSQSGAYSFTISGYKLGTDVKTHTNTDGNTLLSLLQTIESNTEHTAFMQTNAEALSIDGSFAGNMQTNGTRIFNSLMSAVDYNLPSQCTTEAEYLQVIECAKEFRDDYFEYASIAMFNDITTTSQLNTWISNFDSLYKLSEDDAATTAVDESKIYGYLEKQKNKAQMVEQIVATDLTDTASVKARIYEKALLSSIETEISSTAGIIIDSYPTLIGYNTSLYGQLTPSEKLSLYGDFYAKKYANYAVAATSINSLAQALIDARPLAGGGGGGGGGSFAGIMPTVPETVKNKTFADLNGVEWAREAIEYLYNNDIVSGKSDEEFAPQDNITRAEFVKIIVLALDLPLSKGDFFVDVPSNSWYAPYVYAAYDAGLVSGDEENRFNPNDNITRQDMAVILYRAYKLVATYDVLDFADANSVSNYARMAVAYFAQTGIINGMDNNNFVPFGNATRAQAAVMIFRSLNHFGN